MGGWYNIRREDIIELGGYQLLRYYEGSLIKALLSVYPEYPWQVWQFSQVYTGYWDSIDNQREYFDWIGKKYLNITHLDDWYQVERNQYETAAGFTILNMYYGGSLIKALLKVK